MPRGKVKKRTILPEATAIGVLYTTDEVAQLLKVTPRAVQKWIRERKLPAIRYGRVYRVKRADLEKFGVETGRPAPTTERNAQEG
jgi:excisionase family DNA binding protein